MNPLIIQEYVEYLKGKGYSAQTIVVYSRLLKKAPDNWDTQIPQELYENITNELRTKEEYFSTNSWRSFKSASSQLFLMVTGMTIKEYCRKNLEKNTDDWILEDFYRYSTEFKNMTMASALAERNHIERFLVHIGGIPSDWTKITAECLRDYACDVFSNLKPSSVGKYITSLRNFFRFLDYCGTQINPSVLELPLTPSNWNSTSVPIVLTVDEEARIRSHYDTDTPKGKRNTIIVRLMLDLGLRCVEVARLNLSDIRWNNGTICVKDNKNMISRELPLSRDLGFLLEDYVTDFHPHNGNNHLFQRRTLNNQYVSMSQENLRAVIRTAFIKENICGWWKGTHALRRTAASHFYNTGNSLKITADLLGHISLDSTTQYVKVDFESLRLVSSSWPGGDTVE